MRSARKLFALFGPSILLIHLFHRLTDGTVDVLNLTTYQAGDPDPVDRDDPPNPIESNPYGLTVLGNGDALVADAAGNDIIRVTPAGQAKTIARFDLQAIATDHLPADFPGVPLPPGRLVRIGQGESKFDHGDRGWAEQDAENT